MFCWRYETFSQNVIEKFRQFVAGRVNYENNNWLLF